MFVLPLLEVIQWTLLLMEYRVDCKMSFCNSTTQALNYDMCFFFMNAL